MLSILSYPHRKTGFSLLELLIVLLILGILTAIAYPSYRDHLIHARRIEGQTALLDLANRMEGYYSEHHTYKTATLAGLERLTSINEIYHLQIVIATDTAYVLQATPNGAQLSDVRCQSLTLTSEGKRGIARGPTQIPTGTVKQCW